MRQARLVDLSVVTLVTVAHSCLGKRGLQQGLLLIFILCISMWKPRLSGSSKHMSSIIVGTVLRAGTGKGVVRLITAGIAHCHRIYRSGGTMDSANSKKHAFTVKEIADLLQMTDRYTQWYVNLRTGETAYTSDMSMAFEEREEIIERIEGEDGWAALPDSFDIHEWDIMRRFSNRQEEPAYSQLMDAIRGKGAFRMFRSTAERLGLLQDWYDYRDAYLEDMAREWLEDR